MYHVHFATLVHLVNHTANIGDISNLFRRFPWQDREYLSQRAKSNLHACIVFEFNLTKEWNFILAKLDY